MEQVNEECDLQKVIDLFDRGQTELGEIIKASQPRIRWWLVERKGVVVDKFVKPVYDAAMQKDPGCGVTKGGLNPAFK